jgi:hypothetical protein
VLIDGRGFDNRICGPMRNQYRLANLWQQVVTATAFASSSGEAFHWIAVLSGNTAIKIRFINVNPDSIESGLGWKSEPAGVSDPG